MFLPSYSLKDMNINLLQNAELKKKLHELQKEIFILSEKQVSTLFMVLIYFIQLQTFF